MGKRRKNEIMREGKKNMIKMKEGKKTVEDRASGVQRVLDARGQRRSWMPASQKQFSISIYLEKFLMTFF